ncbi:hypothetical protein F4818DRAFT_416866 [Hypoxylon cercidicola]|nr:hypothetical protein F4818DRAFT_416866 [Hypoxylon cercidicola]
MPKMSEQPNIIMESAWMAKMPDLTTFVARSLDIKQSRVTYLQSAHASGKSTTMLKWIMTVINDNLPQPKKATPWFVYVVPRPVEKEFVTDYLLANAGDDGIFENTSSSFDDRFVIVTYEGFLDAIGEKKDWPERVTIMADVELRATVAGEIFFGKLLELVKKNEPVVNLLLVSPHQSARTKSAFEQVVGQVHEIEVPNINPQLQVHTIEGNDWKEQVAGLVEQVYRANTEAKIFVGTSDGGYIDPIAHKNDKEIVHLKGPNVNGLHEAFAGKERIFAIDPEVAVSAPTDNLELVISEGTTRAVLFDTMTSQLVACKRSMTRREIELEQSWALKTSLHREDVGIYMVTANNKRPNITTDPWSRAWNVHLSWLTLRIFSTWPDTNPGDLPIRRPPDVLAFTETMNRLVVMGLLEQDLEGKGRYSTTILGGRALRWMTWWATLPLNATDQLQVHTAYLLAVASMKQDPPNVIRVLIRLAAITACGISKFCVSNSKRGRPSRSAVEAQCDGIGRRLCWKGALWIALGIYQKGMAKDDFRGDSHRLLERDWALVSAGLGYEIQQSVEAIEKCIGLGPAADEIQYTLLNADEVAAVERYLMWAWLHRVIGIRCERGEDTAFDVVSAHLVEIDEARDLFDIRKMTDSPEHQRIGCIFAIYDRLVRCEPGHPMMNKGKHLSALDLTFIPRELYREVQKKIGLKWPIPISTKYPLHRSTSSKG